MLFYAAKTLKDIRLNLMELRHALLPTLQEFSVQYQKALRPFYQKLVELLANPHDNCLSEGTITATPSRQ